MLRPLVWWLRSGRNQHRSAFAQGDAFKTAVSASIPPPISPRKMREVLTGDIAMFPAGCVWHGERFPEIAESPEDSGYCPLFLESSC